jgi:hypothetical protein
MVLIRAKALYLKAVCITPDLSLGLPMNPSIIGDFSPPSFSELTEVLSMGKIRKDI